MIDSLLAMLSGDRWVPAAVLMVAACILRLGAGLMVGSLIRLLGNLIAALVWGLAMFGFWNWNSWWGVGLGILIFVPVALLAEWVEGLVTQARVDRIHERARRHP